MDSSMILTTASSMLETFGDNAKFMAAERMDQAMADGDGGAYDEWQLIGKAIALMSMPRAESLAVKIKPAVTGTIVRKSAAA